MRKILSKILCFFGFHGQGLNEDQWYEHEEDWNGRIDYKHNYCEKCHREVRKYNKFLY
jgi:hypothetical protein